MALFLSPEFQALATLGRKSFGKNPSYNRISVHFLKGMLERKKQKVVEECAEDQGGVLILIRMSLWREEPS